MIMQNLKDILAYDSWDNEDKIQFQTKFSKWQQNQASLYCCLEFKKAIEDASYELDDEQSDKINQWLKDTGLFYLIKTSDVKEEIMNYFHNAQDLRIVDNWNAVTASDITPDDEMYNSYFYHSADEMIDAYLPNNYTTYYLFAKLHYKQKGWHNAVIDFDIKNTDKQLITFLFNNVYASDTKFFDELTTIKPSIKVIFQDDYIEIFDIETNLTISTIHVNDDCDLANELINLTKNYQIAEFKSENFTLDVRNIHPNHINLSPSMLEALNYLTYSDGYKSFNVVEITDDIESYLALTIDTKIIDKRWNQFQLDDIISLIMITNRNIF